MIGPLTKFRINFRDILRECVTDWPPTLSLGTVLAHTDGLLYLEAVLPLLSSLDLLSSFNDTSMIRSRLAP
jgi:hypothetical protein